MYEKKINLIGICCGAEAHHVREMAVAVGKTYFNEIYARYEQTFSPWN